MALRRGAGSAPTFSAAVGERQRMSQTDVAFVGELVAALRTPAGQADPYPVYARLRALGPAVTGPDGTLYVSGYRACTTMLRDHRLRKTPELRLVAAGYPDWRDRPAMRMM